MLGTTFGADIAIILLPLLPQPGQPSPLADDKGRQNA